ncbi:hypothetical protein D3C73_1167940 [compost metagenome]
MVAHQDLTILQVGQFAFDELEVLGRGFASGVGNEQPLLVVQGHLEISCQFTWEKKRALERGVVCSGVGRRGS